MKADIQNKLAALKKASERDESDDESGPESLSAALQPLLHAQKQKHCPDEDEDEESEDDGEEEGSAESEEDEGGDEDEDEDDSDFEDESDDGDESSSGEESAEEEQGGEGRKPALRRPSAASTTSTPTPATPAASEGQVSTDLALVAHESEKSTQLVRNSFLAFHGSVSFFSVHGYQVSST